MSLKKQLDGGNLKLYSDDNPSTTIIGTEYKNKKMAIRTLKLIRNRSIIYQKSVINTMYNRAKYHKNQTNEMSEAMNIFKKWLDKYNNFKRKYRYIDLETVKFDEKLANEYGISKISRGIKKSTKSEKGFLVMS